MTLHRHGIRLHTAVRWTIAVGLGAVFVYASLDKIAHPRDFARIVYHYRLLGPNRALGFLPANVFAVTLPWIEALAGFLLIAGVWRREAALVAAFLLVLFLTGVGSAIIQRIDVENCGCFVVAGKGRPAGLPILIEDAALLAGALLLLVAAPHSAPVAGAADRKNT